MWSVEQLREILPGLQPPNHSFTYTYPPPYIAKRHGQHGGVALESINEWPDLSAYLHIPFCSITCNFCSLHRRLAVNEGPVESYLDSLQRELRAFRTRVSSPTLKSLYIGGGTPSTVDAHRLTDLLDLLAHITPHDTSVEVTIECAPDAVRSTADWSRYLSILTSHSSLPVTRVSVGVQAWDDRVLRRMGRGVTRQNIIQMLQAIKTLDLQFNIDFILGYPRGHPWKAAEESTQITDALREMETLNIKPPSVSVYQLWDVTEITATRHKLAQLPSAPLLARELWLVQERLYQMGYEQGAGASFIADRSSLHEWTVHRCREFRHAGFGSGAYSIHPTSLILRERDIDGYQRAFPDPPLSWFEADKTLNQVYTLNSEEIEIRRIIAGLRSSRPTKMPQNWSTPSIEEVRAKIQCLVGLDILSLHDGMVSLCPDAFMLTNAVSTYLHPTRTPRKA